jgi:hypothetical protein
MNHPQHIPQHIMKDQNRKGIIEAVKTPLGFSTLTVLVLEGLFLTELMKKDSYIPEDKRFYLIIALLVGLILMTLMAYFYTSAEAKAVASKELVFTVHVIRRMGRRGIDPVKGAKVTLWKNDQQVGGPQQTDMMGDTVFYIPVDKSDAVKVKVEVAGKNPQEVYLITPVFQQSRIVEYVD